MVEFSITVPANGNPVSVDTPTERAILKFCRPELPAVEFGETRADEDGNRQGDEKEQIAKDPPGQKITTLVGSDGCREQTEQKSDQEKRPFESVHSVLSGRDGVTKGSIDPSSLL
jgi:hypothetical protein